MRLANRPDGLMRIVVWLTIQKCYPSRIALPSPLFRGADACAITSRRRTCLRATVTRRPSAMCRIRNAVVPQCWFGVGDMVVFEPLIDRARASRLATRSQVELSYRNLAVRFQYPVFGFCFWLLRDGERSIKCIFHILFGC